MSAVLKQVQNIEPEESLQELLVLPEQAPLDFYKNPVYLERIKQTTALARSLVHTIDDDGRLKAKSDAAAIRKNVKTTNGFALSVFRTLTDKVKTWRDDFTTANKELEGVADEIMAKFEKLEKEKLDGIKLLLTDGLNSLWDSENVKPEFRNGSIDSLVKLNGTLTDKGILTKKAKDFIVAIVNDNRVQQRKIEVRILLLENRCLRADINPPLTQAHFGTVFYADDQFFNEKMDELIATEVERRAEMEARIIKQQEEQKQKEIADALKAQQDESDRVAREKVQKEAEQNKAQEQPKPAIETREEREQRFKDANRKQQQEAAAKNGVTIISSDAKPVESVQVNNGKRIARFTAEFEVSVSERVSDSGVEAHFLSKLPEDLKAILKVVRF